VLHVSRDGVTTDVAARVVVDATGLGRGLGDQGCRPTEAAPGARVGLGCEVDDPGYPVGPGEVRMVIGRRGYVGLVRVESGALNVAAAVDPQALAERRPHALVCDILSEGGLPPLPVDALDAWRGTPPLLRTRGEVGAERLLRVGDAAGYVEPFTGEGICWALADGRAAAEVAARALGGWSTERLREWQRYRHGRRRRAERLCRVLAWALRRPAIVDAAMASLQVAPSLATPLVRRAARAPRSLSPASA
jgi:2-polyprenyl-6-methoxyphenol hydroxylase-like FAD-dependent oxidoreductase